MSKRNKDKSIFSLRKEVESLVQDVPPVQTLTDTIIEEPPLEPEVTSPVIEDEPNKKELLTEEEKDLLKSLNAFSGYNMLWVLKRAEGTTYEQLKIRLSTLDKTVQYTVALPMFKSGSKFMNLELNKMYELSELGI